MPQRVLSPKLDQTYFAVYRLAARPYQLSNVFGAAGRKQFATIFHTVAATRLVRLRNVWVALRSASAAVDVMADLVRLTAATPPATGNPAITPRLMRSGIVPVGPGAAEATCLALPTTAGSEGADIVSNAMWSLGITGAGSAINPPPPVSWIDLLALSFAESKPEHVELPVMYPGVAEGWAVTLDASAAATVTGLVVIRFTEEAEDAV